MIKYSGVIAVPSKHSFHFVDRLEKKNKNRASAYPFIRSLACLSIDVDQYRRSEIRNVIVETGPRVTPSST